MVWVVVGIAGCVLLLIGSLVLMVSAYIAVRNASIEQRKHDRKRG